MKSEVIKKSKVLLVDDDRGMRETLADILGAMKYEVASAESGAEAVKKFKENPFDVVLMDVKMPGMGGIEACRRIKAIKPEAKIILITAYATDREVIEAEKEGTFSVLYKPLDIKKMLKLIEEG